MAILEEIKTLQGQGLPEDQIVQTLQEKGHTYRQISEALSQSKIKAAVEAPINGQPLNLGDQPIAGTSTPDAPIPTTEAPSPPAIPAMPTETPPVPQSPDINQMPPTTPPETMPGMQQSMLQSPEPQEQTQEYIPTPQPGQQDYGNYDPYQYDYSGGGISPDTISEISEQIMSEKLMEIRKHLEKIIDFKTSVETRTEALDERLKRIEKIIDSLQSSVLRKVGDYITNVDDIKKELIETQKSFTKLLPEMKKAPKKTAGKKRKK